MIGYHYTTLEAWQKIQVEGLIPYKNKKKEYRPFFPSGVISGIWLWKEKPIGKSHLGNILRVLAVHNTDQIVFLQVDIPQEWLVCVPITHWHLTFPHFGKIDQYVYHEGEVGVICGKAIPSKHIVFLQQYNLLELIVDHV